LGRLRDVLGTARLTDLHATDETLPAWAHLLAEAIAAEREMIELHGCLSPNDPIPFEDVLLPFVEVARRSLNQRTTAQAKLLTDAAHAQLERRLLQDLSKVAGQALHLEFQMFRTAK